MNLTRLSLWRRIILLAGVVVVTWQAADGESHTLITRADPGATAVLTDVGSEVVLRTLAGSRFRLEFGRDSALR